MAGENQIFSNPPRPEQLERLLRSPETAQLLQLLQQDGGKRLELAAKALREGRAAEAKAALAPLLEGGKAEELTKTLERKL